MGEAATGAAGMDEVALEAITGATGVEEVELEATTGVMLGATAVPSSSSSAVLELGSTEGVRVTTGGELVTAAGEAADELEDGVLTKQGSSQ